MSKKLVELYTVLGDHPDSVLVAKAWLETKGDLYVTRHAPHLLAGKYSYHKSGVTHSYTELVSRRAGEGQPLGQTLRGLQGYQRITGWGCPAVLEPTGYEPKPDTEVRRTLVAPRAEIGWYWFIWAIEPGRRDLAGRISRTDPWPSIPIVASLLADWSDPWLLITFGHWTNTQPYEVVRYAPALPGRTPVEIIPHAYDGTWLDLPGPRWRPGEPFPVEWLQDAEEYVARKERLSKKRKGS